MAVVFNKYIIGVFLIFSSFAVIAEGTEIEFEKKMMSMALEEFLSAKEVAENIIDSCEKMEKNIVIPRSSVLSIDISSRDLEIALYYLNRKARDDCEGSYLAQFYVSASRYRATAKHYGREAEEALPYTEEKLYGSAWREFRIKLDYYGIEASKRKALENIAELKKPFNLHKTLVELDVH